MAKSNRDYVKIPVTPEVYERVRLISSVHGFGERGLGKLIAYWAARELPECDHEKQPVEIEYFPSETKSIRMGWYCSTCKRVYARENES